MRADNLYRVALAMRQTRSEDWLGMVAMVALFVCALAVFEAAAITLLDWMDGRPNSVLPALMALFERAS